MFEQHKSYYVQTRISVHEKYMKFSSFMSVSAAIMSNCEDKESAEYWFTKACKDGIVFW